MSNVSRNQLDLTLICLFYFHPGIITIPGSGGGMLLGGYLPKKMALRCRGIIKLCLICMSICLLFAPTFLINCSDQPLAGLNTPYAEQR